MFELLIHLLHQSVGVVLAIAWMWRQVISSPHYIRELVICWWTFSALNWYWVNSPKHISSCNLCCCNESTGCARHANKRILKRLLDKDYKLYDLDFCENSNRLRPKPKTDTISFLASITAFTHIIGNSRTHFILSIHIRSKSLLVP